MSDTNGTLPYRPTIPPRHREELLTNGKAEPTQRPHRAQHPPNGATPSAPDPQVPPVEAHWRKHPSDYHADLATGALVDAAKAVDSAKRAEHLLIGQIQSNLSLRDAILEHAAVMRDIRDGKSAKQGHSA